MKLKMKKALFAILSLFVLIFFLWSKLIVISVIVLFLVDSFTLQLVPKYLLKKLPLKVFYGIKLVYFFITPLFIVVFFRLFFFDVYYVPSSSMERTLFPGDYVIINKIKYGVKIPNHFRNIPVVGNLFKAPKNDYDLYRTLPKLEEIQRNTIVVFKAVDDTDKFLIKRVIGLPGEEIEIKKGEVFINKTKLEQNKNYVYNYLDKRLKKIKLIKNFSNKEFEELSSIEKQNFERELKQVDNYKRLRIPKKGMKILLNKENIKYYVNIMKKFENVDMVNFNAKEYTFKKDYFFAMGDNRHNSIDSRFFGLVPESYILGSIEYIF